MDCRGERECCHQRQTTCEGQEKRKGDWPRKPNAVQHKRDTQSGWRVGVGRAEEAENLGKQIAKDRLCLDRKWRLYHRCYREVPKYFKKGGDVVKFECPEILLHAAGKPVRVCDCGNLGVGAAIQVGNVDGLHCWRRRDRFKRDVFQGRGEARITTAWLRGARRRRHSGWLWSFTCAAGKASPLVEGKMRDEGQMWAGLGAMGSASNILDLRYLRKCAVESWKYRLFPKGQH